MASTNSDLPAPKHTPHTVSATPRSLSSSDNPNVHPHSVETIKTTTTKKKHPERSTDPISYEGNCQWLDPIFVKETCCLSVARPYLL